MTYSLQGIKKNLQISEIYAAHRSSKDQSGNFAFNFFSILYTAMKHPVHTFPRPQGNV